MVLVGRFVLLVAEAVLRGVCSRLCSQADSVELRERERETNRRTRVTSDSDKEVQVERGGDVQGLQAQS